VSTEEEAEEEAEEGTASGQTISRVSPAVKLNVRAGKDTKGKVAIATEEATLTAPVTSIFMLRALPLRTLK